MAPGDELVDRLPVAFRHDLHRAVREVPRAAPKREPLGLVGVVTSMRRDLVEYSLMVWNALRRRRGTAGEGTDAIG